MDRVSKLPRPTFPIFWARTNNPVTSSDWAATSLLHQSALKTLIEPLLYKSYCTQTFMDMVNSPKRIDSLWPIRCIMLQLFRLMQTTLLLEQIFQYSDERMIPFLPWFHLIFNTCRRKTLNYYYYYSIPPVLRFYHLHAYAACRVIVCRLESSPAFSWWNRRIHFQHPSGPSKPYPFATQIHLAISDLVYSPNVRWTASVVSTEAMWIVWMWICEITFKWWSGVWFFGKG